MGTEAKIDMRPSGIWLKEKTAHWTFKKHLKIGVKRDEALEILSSEGTLLVLCSLIDNMPYVVAEAAVSSTPSHLLPLVAACAPGWCSVKYIAGSMSELPNPTREVCRSCGEKSQMLRRSSISCSLQRSFSVGRVVLIM